MKFLATTVTLHERIETYKEADNTNATETILSPHFLVSTLSKVQLKPQHPHSHTPPTHEYLLYLMQFLVNREATVIMLVSCPPPWSY